MATSEKLRQQLEQVHAELHQVDGPIGADRETLENLATDIRSILAHDQIEEHHYGGLGDRLKTAVAEVEANHPSATLRLRQLIDELAYLGV
jgi:hypothetical protein